MTTTTSELWSEPVTRRIFGIVPEVAVRRHPSELWRILAAVIVLAVTAVLSRHVSTWEKAAYALMADLPEGLRDALWVLYLLGTAVVLVGLAIAVLVARRLRFALILTAAGVVALVLGVALQSLVDSAAVRHAAGLDDPSTPEFPVVLLAVATAVILVASSYLTRTARHLVVGLLVVSCASAMLLTIGLTADVFGALALGWAVAAGVRFAVGSPAGTPSVEEVDQALRELGVRARDLDLTPEQVWGEVRYTATEETAAGDVVGPLSIIVIGRDASDARLISKLWRFLWYKDSGPQVSLTRLGELERRAYLLLLAAQAGIPVEHVVAAGTAGEDEDAVLVLREPSGVRLPALAADELTDDVLVDAWSMADRLHGTRVVHGTLTAGNVLRQHDGSIALLDFTRASSARTPTRVALDRVELLSTTAALVGADRALTAAEEVLGRDGMADLLSFLEPAAVSAAARKEIGDRRDLLKTLREAGAERAGVDAPTLVPLRRISATNVLMAVGTILGVYLLIAQFSDVPDLWESIRSAQKGWVVVTALLSQLPQFAGAFVMLGSVATQLPYGPTLAVQFANNFVGFVAGSVGNTAMIIRYFQRQGLTIAVAVSSGVLKTISGMAVQFTLIVIALIATWGDYDIQLGGSDSSSGSSSGGHTDLILILIIVAGIAVGAMVTVPRLRKRVHSILAPQIASARTNLREIAGMPVKVVQLFGGNLVSEILFAMVLGASLHAYGQSLSLLQLILINSFASLIGGLAPIPGGMGVVEAGMIAGFTAAGVPQTEAVAATFTARLFTTYLPPIWGWFALRWLRRRNLV